MSHAPSCPAFRTKDPVHCRCGAARTEALANLPHGWFWHGDRILQLLYELHPQICVELGSWKGASAIAILKTITAWQGVLYCVDTWTGGKGAESAWGTQSSSPEMLLECASNIVAAGLGASVRFIPSTTVGAGFNWIDNPIDFLYIDADHSYESVRDDLAMWWKHLRDGGCIVGDDYRNPKYPGTTLAWDNFERETGQQFIREPNDNLALPGMALIWGIKR